MNVRFRWKADIGECLLNTENNEIGEKIQRDILKEMVARGGIEPPTQGFSVFKAKILCVSEIV